MVNKSVLVENIDLDLLRKQRDCLLKYQEVGKEKLIDGVINMLDDILDKGEEE